MASPINHQQKLVSLLAGFFRTKRASEALRFLGKWEMDGWEKWWQHELVMHLDRSPQIAEWKPEYRTPVVNQRLGNSRHMYFDVALKFKEYSPSNWFLLELKQNSDYRLCLRRMKKDIDKFSRADGKHLDGLGWMAFVGVVPSHEEDEDIYDYAEEILDPEWYDTFLIRRLGKHHKLIVA